MRCKNQNCKVKLNKSNCHTFAAYSDEDIATNDFAKIKRPKKIRLCIDCAKMYMGKFFDEDERFSTSLTTDMEFSKEFQKDIFNKID